MKFRQAYRLAERYVYSLLAVLNTVDLHHDETALPLDLEGVPIVRPEIIGQSLG